MNERLMPDIKIIFMQMLRFGLVGVVAAGIHFCCVIFLVEMGYCPPLVANVFSFLISFQISYWGHRLFTFADVITLHRVALPKLLSVQLLNFTASESLFYIFLKLDFPYPLALLFVLTILPLFTFISSKFWVFR